MIKLLIYFFTGIFLDILIVLYYYSIYEKKVFLSFLLTFILGLLQTLVLYHIIEDINYLLDIIIYSLGCSIGTAFIVYLKKKNKLKKILK